MAGAFKKRSMPALGWWLMAVGTYRSVFVWSCFIGYASLCAATFSEIQVTDVHGRTTAVWTLLSCTLCFLCAFNLNCKPLYAATFLSFVYIIGYLSVEYVVYHTISVAASLFPYTFIVGVTTIVWMLLEWNAHGSCHDATSKQH